MVEKFPKKNGAYEGSLTKLCWQALFEGSGDFSLNCENLRYPSHMAASLEMDSQLKLTSLTRAIYAFSGGILIYLLLQYSAPLLLARTPHGTGATYSLYLRYWYYGNS